MSKYIMAFDQGTTSTRVIVFDKDQKVVATAQKEIVNLFPKPGYVEIDPNEIWLSVLACTSEVFQKTKIKPCDIEAIGITNQRETTILWDKNTGIPVYNAIVWQSRQTTNIIEEVKSLGYEKVIQDKTGLILNPYFSASKIKWIRDNVPGVKDNPDIIFGTVDTWLVWHLSNGKKHVTDVSNASRTLLYNIHTLSWDDELLKIFDIPKTMLPEVVNTSGVIGEVEPYNFFNESPKICAICGDQQAALFGQSCLSKGDLKSTYGTGGFILMNTGKDIIKSNSGLVSTIAWQINDEVNYALEGSIFVSGSLIQWLRDNLRFFENAKESEKIATSISSNEGVYIVPAFVGLGAPYWDDDAKGSIFGLTRNTDYRHLVRAALESMAYQTYDLIKIMEKESDTKVSSLKVDGGASLNNFLLGFQSDILNIEVVRQKNSELTTLGVARLAGLAINYYDWADFNDDIDTIFKPQMDEKEIAELLIKWHKAVKCCMEYK